jgi:transposase-like protein
MNNTDRELINATEAIAKNLGVKFCTQCNLTRPVEGGKVFTLVNGRTRWKCATCFKKLKPSGVF